MSKDSSARYYHENKERLQKKERKLEKGIKIFLKKKKIKRDNMVVSNIKISLKMKTKAK